MGQTQHIDRVHPLVLEIDDFIREQGILPPETACLVAVSGGCDSMLLLEALTALSARHQWRLVVAHFHHQLRGADADLDQQLVESATTRRGLRMVAGTADVLAAARERASLEAVSRELRHDFLARTAVLLGCDRIALGHHADDQAELFLLRLLRGAGARGLAGMSACDPSPADPALTLIRPLLPFPRSRIQQAARDLSVQWREDTSNRDLHHSRNRVRAELIPYLEERFQPALTHVLLREQVILRDQYKVVAELASQWLTATADRSRFETLPAAVQREVLRQQLAQARVPISYDRIEELRLEPGQVFQVDSDRAVQQQDGILTIVAPAATPLSSWPGEINIEFGGTQGSGTLGDLIIEWQSLPAAGHGAEFSKTPGAEVFDQEVLGPRIRIRHWQPGDRFRPIGLTTAAKLQDLFTNARIPAIERRERGIAETADGEIFWVEGLRIGELAKVSSHTRRVLVWKWRRASMTRFTDG